MIMIPQCDKCGKVYEDGYQGFYKKVISKGKKLNPKDFTIEINIRPPHLCDKCFKALVRECLKGGV